MRLFYFLVLFPHFVFLFAHLLFLRRLADYVRWLINLLTGLPTDPLNAHGKSVAASLNGASSLRLQTSLLTAGEALTFVLS